jgi:hypothetical protein
MIEKSTNECLSILPDVRQAVRAHSDKAAIVGSVGLQRATTIVANELIAIADELTLTLELAIHTLAHTVRGRVRFASLGRWRALGSTFALHALVAFLHIIDCRIMIAEVGSMYDSIIRIADTGELIKLGDKSRGHFGCFFVVANR